MHHLRCIKSHQELQREVTQKELASSPLFLHVHICSIDMQMPAKFQEIPSMGLQDTLRTDRRTNAHTHGRTDGQHENSVPPQNLVLAGGIIIAFDFNLICHFRVQSKASFAVR